MGDNLVLSVRQITQYPPESAVAATDVLLLQSGGLGGPYLSATAPVLVGTALIPPTSVMGIGVTPPADPDATGLFLGSDLQIAPGAFIQWNLFDGTPGLVHWQAGYGGSFGQDPNGTFLWLGSLPGTPGTLANLSELAGLDQSGNFSAAGTVSDSKGELAPLASPAFTGIATVPDPAASDSSHQIANTEWVLANSVASFNTRIGAVVLTVQDIQGAGGAPNNSPQFVGVPRAPTPPTPPINAPPDQIATCGWVGSEFAALASPAFTGTPTAPTPALGDNSTNVATTAFVESAVAASVAGVASFNTRTGAVLLTAADITGAGGALALTEIVGSLAANVAMASTSTFYDGPSVAQGSIGTWLVIGHMTLAESVVVECQFQAILTDGTTTYAQGGVISPFANGLVSITLSAIVTNPAGNLVMQGLDQGGVNGLIYASPLSGIVAVRIA